tara:strand:+ start:180 stop:422 length:243 start_codon:yes stop_codon:yes gene_type:complete
MCFVATERLFATEIVTLAQTSQSFLGNSFRGGLLNGVGTIESGIAGVLVKLDGNDARPSGGLRGHHGGKGLEKVFSDTLA